MYFRVRYKGETIPRVRLVFYTNTSALFEAIPDPISLAPTIVPADAGIRCAFKAGERFGNGQWAVLGIEENDRGVVIDVLGVQVLWLKE